jgi:hypothetical protein
MPLWPSGWTIRTPCWSEFVVGSSHGDIRPNPGYDGILIVQNGMEGELGWDGDLDKCFGLVSMWCRDANFRAGWVCANGGGVTESEIQRSVRAGYPTILIHGFGRKTDEIAAAYQRGNLKWLPRRGHCILIADHRDPQSLRHALLEADLL